MKLTVLHGRLKCSIQARSASKGKCDPSPRNQARIPSLARRAWMEFLFETFSKSPRLTTS